MTSPAAWSSARSGVQPSATKSNGTAGASANRCQQEWQNHPSARRLREVNVDPQCGQRGGSANRSIVRRGSIAFTIVPFHPRDHRAEGGFLQGYFSASRVARSTVRAKRGLWMPPLPSLWMRK